MNPEDYRWICPITSKLCAHKIPCLLTEETGKSNCREWVLRQREAGKKAIEAAQKEIPAVGTTQELKWD